METIQIDIVSAESEIYSGKAKSIIATGGLGEMGITPGHAQLLTNLKPGQVTLIAEDNSQHYFYISGGMLEVQPEVVTVLADTAVRAGDLDEAKAEEAKRRAEDALRDNKSEIDYAKASSELARAVAQLRVIKQLRKLKK